MSSEDGDAPVYWLLGLPIDLVGIEAAMSRIEQAIARKERLVFATPNVDFLAQARSDRAFCESILRAQLSLVDGMPLVWLGRLLGIAIPERVAGSTLIEHFLARPRGRPIRVFFFGGPEGAAESACAAVDRANGALRGAGACYPGVGDVARLSAPSMLAEINASGADLLVVALGARKGHAWIDRNASRLNVPVISHLGAVVNFLAGNVRRAPIAMQRCGLEWLWRTIQEPSLIGRYAGNAWFLLTQLGAILPLVVGRAVRRMGIGIKPLSIETLDGRMRTLKLTGDLVAADLPLLKSRVRARRGDVAQGTEIDLSGVTDLDGASLGYLYRLKYRSEDSGRVRIVNHGRRAARLLRRHRAEVLVGDTGIEPVTSAV